MKLRLFNKGRGWYISASNYKDHSDKAYMNLYFPNSTEPTYHQTEQGYDIADINILEAKFNAYQGKIGMTVFKYEFIDNLPRSEGQNLKPSNSPNVELSSDDYPFY